MNGIDKRNLLDDEIFTYRVSKQGKGFIHWRNKQVKTLGGERARKFLGRMEDLDPGQAQLELAKVTGNFKRGNERR